MAKRITALGRAGKAASTSTVCSATWSRSYANKVRMATKYSASKTGVVRSKPSCVALAATAIAPEGLTWLINRLTSVKPSITTPNAAASTCPCPARCHTGSLRKKKSINTRNTRFTTQLPSASPTAKLGALATVTLVIPVASSGNEVTVASNASPIQLPDKPVRRAMASP